MTDDNAAVAPGFYWIAIDSLPPEIARRDAEAGEWILIGAERTMTTIRAKSSHRRYG